MDFSQIMQWTIIICSREFHQWVGTKSGDETEMNIIGFHYDQLDLDHQQSGGSMDWFIFWGIHYRKYESWLVVDLPLWKIMEFVNWDDYIPYILENKVHVPNHQPDPMVFLWFSYGFPMIIRGFYENNGVFYHSLRCLRSSFRFGESGSAMFSRTKP